MSAEQGGPSNAVHMIFPYRHPEASELWVFDDARFGLQQEPFVCGASEAIERIVSKRGLGDRVKAIFSVTPLPGSDVTLRRMGEPADARIEGCHYHDGTAELWLCPAMTHYFGPKAPAEIHVRLEGRPA